MAKIFDYIANKGSLYSETGILGVVTGGLLHTKTNKGWMLPCTASKYIAFTLPSLAQKSIITVTKINNNYVVTQNNTTATITSLVLNNANYLRYIIYDSVASATSDLKNIQAWVNILQPLTYQKRLLSLPKPTELKQSGLVAAYNMQPVGNILPDISGNGNNGTITGYPLVGLKGMSNWIKGIVRITANTTLVGNITFSFRCFIKSVGGGGYGRVFENGSTAIRMNNVLSNGFTFTRDASTMATSGALTANTWVNCNITTTSTGITNFYINGVQSGTINQPTVMGVQNTTWDIGNVSTLIRSFDGTISDFRIHNRILSLQEIKAYHNNFNEVILHEKFEDMSVGSNKLPSGWIKNGGSFVCEEHYKKKGELVVNGGFDTNLSSWNPDIDWTWSNGTAKHKSLGNPERMIQNCLTVGKFYKVSFTITASNILGNIELKLGSGSTKIYTNPTNGQYIYTGACIGNSFLYILGSPTWEGSIDNVSVTEIDPLPNFKNGTKYLRCITAGIVAIPCKWVNGTIKNNIYKAGNTVNDWLFTSTVIGAFNTTGQNGYLLRWDTDNKFKLYKITNGVLSAALITSVNTYPPSWYEPTVTRTTSGVFTVYINGVSIGTATDTTFNTSNYNQHNCIANDRITNINIQSQIKA